MAETVYEGNTWMMAVELGHHPGVERLPAAIVRFRRVRAVEKDPRRPHVRERRWLDSKRLASLLVLSFIPIVSTSFRYCFQILNVFIV